VTILRGHDSLAGPEPIAQQRDHLICRALLVSFDLNMHVMGWALMRIDISLCATGTTVSGANRLHRPALAA
jgi:hypothetical protein